MTLTLTLPYGEKIYTGKQVTFKAPCESEGLTGLIIDGVTYDLVSAMGVTLVGNSFDKDAMVSVIFNIETMKAYVQNADTNTYLEDKFKSIEDKVGNIPAADVSGAISTHNTSTDAHDDIRKAISERAPTNHGNHIPATQTADNATFLRNDNTWQKVTPENIGAAKSSHEHSADDITSGILPVERGGTGVDSLSALAAAIGACRIQTGSYIGTGKNGSSNPNSLTFNFVPKVVFIVGEADISCNSSFFVYGCSDAFVGGMKTYAESGYQGACEKLTWSGSSVSWWVYTYSSGEHTASGDIKNAYQLNASNTTYYWVAIG